MGLLSFLGGSSPGGAAADVAKGVLDGVGGVADKLIRDFKLPPEAALAFEQAKLQAQTEINKAEATNASLFVAGWRPYVGWICGSGLAYQFLLQPLLSWASSIWHIPSPPPLDIQTLTTVLFGMLGLGAMHSYDKKQGTTPPGVH